MPTLPDDDYEERAAICEYEGGLARTEAEAEAWHALPSPDAALRLALVLWQQDASTTLTPEQRTWLTARLATHAPLTPQERARLQPPLLAWAAQQHPTILPALRRACGLGEAARPGMSGLELLRAYPGHGAEAQAEALRGGHPTQEGIG